MDKVGVLVSGQLLRAPFAPSAIFQTTSSWIPNQAERGGRSKIRQLQRRSCMVRETITPNIAETWITTRKVR